MTPVGHSDQLRWEAKYRAMPAEGPGPVSPFLERYADLLGTPRGWALDLACGTGRHALWLARRGWSVVALDIAPTALARLAAVANADPDVKASGGCITGVVADAMTWPLAPASVSVLVVSRFLERDLMPCLVESLAPRGVLFYETFTTGQLAEPTGPKNPAYLLEPGELRRAFATLEILAAHEGRVTSGEHLSSLLARRP